MKPQEPNYEEILALHEPKVSGSDLTKIAYKEKVYLIWAMQKERIRDAIIARKKRREAKFLARVLARVSEQKQAEAERIERMLEIREVMRRQALISASKPSISQADADNMSEEGYYMSYAMMHMRARESKGKKKKQIEKIIEEMKVKMQARGYATDIREVSELIQLIPEEERKKVLNLAQKMKIL